MKEKNITWEMTKVNREQFLRTSLLPYYSSEKIEQIIHHPCVSDVIEHEILDEIGNTCIRRHCMHTGGISLLTSLSGALGTVLLLPVDFVQFAYHMAKLAQELYILYGTKQMIQCEKKEDLEVLQWMLAGASGATSLLATSLSAYVQTLFAKTMRAKTWHHLSMIPWLGCGIHAGTSAYTLYALAEEYREHLVSMRENNQVTSAQGVVQEFNNIIDVEYHEIEETCCRFCDLSRLRELYRYLSEGYIDEQQFQQLKQML